MAAIQSKTWEIGPQADHRATILVTTVELGPGYSATITLLEGDDPQDAALQFCLDHGLPDTVVEPLTLHILENLERLEAENELQLSQAEDIHAIPEQAPDSPRDSVTSPKPRLRGQSLVREAEQTAAEIEATLASYGNNMSTAAGTSITAAPLTNSAAGSNPTNPPLIRPSSATSSLGTEYYGRPLPSANTARTAAAEAAPAADRLYADHFRKQAMLDEQRRIRDLELQLAMQQVYCTPLSRHMAAHRNAGGYSSYGERLYAEGRLEQMRREAEQEQLRAEEAEAELAGVTFKPQISKLAQGLKKQASVGGARAPWDRLYSQGTALKKQRRAEAIRKEQEDSELKECSFKPRVDRNSARLVQERRGGMVLRGIGGSGNKQALPLYERLYNEGLYKKEIKEENASLWLPDGATFKPRINRSSCVVGDLLAAAAEDENGAIARDVAERLLLRGRRYQERLEFARKEREAPVDEAGRPLFQPRTLSPRKGIKVQRSGPIGEHLYSAAIVSSARAAALKEAAVRQAQSAAASKHVNSLSERMMDRLKKERFKAIFEYLARGNPPKEINLLEILNDEAFMNTIDPEVRADVEHAGRLLTKTLMRRAALATGDQSGNEENDWPVGGIEHNPQQQEVPMSARSAASTALPAPEREILWASSKSGEINEAGFIALMQEVLHRTRGIARQYLLPLPSTRKKWQDPTFKPAVDPKSLALAARTRPDGLPGYEILYNTAQEIAQKKVATKKALEEAALRECSFKPAFISAPLASEGRALKLAAQPRPTREERERQAAEEAARLAVLEAEEEEERQRQMKSRKKAAQQARGTRAASAAAGGGDGGNEHANSAKGAGALPPVHAYDLSEYNIAASNCTPSDALLSAADIASHLISMPLGSDLDYGSVGSTPSKSAGLEDGIDAIERQIQEAINRLSLSGECFVAHINGKKTTINVAAEQQKGEGMVPAGADEEYSEFEGGATEREHRGETPLPNAAELEARLRASLDYNALFGAGSPPHENLDGDTNAGNEETSVSAAPSSDADHELPQFSHFNPLAETGNTPIDASAYHSPSKTAGDVTTGSARRSKLHELAAAPMESFMVNSPEEGSGSCC